MFIGAKCVNDRLDLFLKFRVVSFPASKVGRQSFQHL